MPSESDLTPPPPSFGVESEEADDPASPDERPLKIGDHVEVTITDIAFGGEGIGRLEAFVIFIPFVALGEQVEGQVTEVKRRYARARLTRVLQPSADRVVPPCPYFGDCGGCQYQHLDYAAQLVMKRNQIAGLLERIGGFPPGVVEAVAPCPQPYGYRNRVMVRSQWDKIEQRLRIGFLKAESRLLVDVESCEISEPAINDQLAHLRAHPPPRGGLKSVLRLPPDSWDVPPDSFFQNNFHALPRLVEIVRQRLRDHRSNYLADLYCGVGFFSLSLADLVRRFVGVEYDKRAIEAARRNQASRGIENGEYVAGRTEDRLEELLRSFPLRETTVILDPPRTGCDPSILERLRAARPAQLLYISCHPATLARDLKLLADENCFRLASLAPVDMFPQTQHVECVADLRACP